MTPAIRSTEIGKLDDTVLVKRILQGEKELFEIILRRYNQKLYRIIRGYLRDTEDIQDTMQETYLKAFDKLYQFQGTSAFSTWLIRIGINEALQKIKKRGKTVSLKSDNEEDDYKIIQLPASKQMNPEYAAINHETRKLIELSIDALPEKYRSVYIMREVEGMEISTIADCLGLEINNVKVRIHRAKSLMKDSLLRLSSDTAIFEFGSSKCDSVVDYVMRRI
jgi:RNA polymerase sigma factor (sigma-70 family)